MVAARPLSTGPGGEEEGAGAVGGGLVQCVSCDWTGTLQELVLQHSDMCPRKTVACVVEVGSRVKCACMCVYVCVCGGGGQ